ncbi:MAG: hypothetical protein M0R80_23595 [Proteobacteria bacterium]|nr:hypothetical protein [Pseudomonadota bacterium]
MNEATRTTLAEKCNKLNLVGIYEMPDGTWVVTDGRTANNYVHPCSSKGAVLEKIGQLLEVMQPAAELEDNDPVEMTILITTQVSLCDPEDKNKITSEQLRKSVQTAIRDALDYGENEGFVHPLAEDVSIGMAGVDVLCVDTGNHY